MTDQLVTILIPTYNRADFLPEAIRSGLAQTHARLEVIVLDDASPDDGRTAAAVEPFLSDRRVRYVRHPANIGIAENWRAGIRMAAGSFYCLLHDDDTYEPTFVAELSSAMTDDAVIAFCDHWVTDAMGVRDLVATDRATHRFRRDRLTAGPLADFARAALVDTAVPIGATLFRRSDATPDLIDDNARGSVDMWLLYGCVRSGKRAVYVSRRLMNYRSHTGGMSASRPLYMTEGHLWRYDRMIADPRLSAIHPELRAMRDRARTDYGVFLLEAGRRAEARATLAGRAGRKAMIGRLLAQCGPVGTVAVRVARRWYE